MTTTISGATGVLLAGALFLLGGVSDGPFRSGPFGTIIDSGGGVVIQPGGVIEATVMSIDTPVALQYVDVERRRGLGMRTHARGAMLTLRVDSVLCGSVPPQVEVFSGAYLFVTEAGRVRFSEPTSREGVPTAGSSLLVPGTRILTAVAPAWNRDNPVLHPRIRRSWQFVGAAWMIERDAAGHIELFTIQRPKLGVNEEQQYSEADIESLLAGARVPRTPANEDYEDGKQLLLKSHDALTQRWTLGSKWRADHTSDESLE